jgi:diguanylate cyclase (GGDEF)-like protein
MVGGLGVTSFALSRLVEEYLETATSTVMLELDDDLRIVRANGAWSARFAPARELEGEPLASFVDGMPRERIRRAGSGEVIEAEVTAWSWDGAAARLGIWATRSASGFLVMGEVRESDPDAVVARMSRIHQQMADATRRFRRENADLRRSAEEMEALADTDPLTGLLNRRGWTEAFESLLSLARRRREPAVVVMLDVDHFKEINDRHGHPVGDRVLQTIAAVIQAECRREDVAGRYGGEEFVVALADTGLDAARSFAERLRRTTALASREAGPTPATISLGVTEASGSEDTHAVVARADRALYQAKRSGRNRVAVETGRCSDDEAAERPDDPPALRSADPASPAAPGFVDDSR